MKCAWALALAVSALTWSEANPEVSPDHFLTSTLTHLLPFLESLCHRPFTTRDIYLLNASDATKISFHLVTDVVIQPSALP